MILLFQESDDFRTSFEWQVLGQLPANDGRYLLELARCFSIERHSELVLCKQFLPTIDVAVSAAEDGWQPLKARPADIERRHLEFSALIEHTQEALRHSMEWCRATLSFGLVRWWPLYVRPKAVEALGPFPVVMDCAIPASPKIHLAAAAPKPPP